MNCTGPLLRGEGGVHWLRQDAAAGGWRRFLAQRSRARERYWGDACKLVLLSFSLLACVWHLKVLPRWWYVTVQNVLSGWRWCMLVNVHILPNHVWCPVTNYNCIILQEDRRLGLIPFYVSSLWVHCVSVFVANISWFYCGDERMIRKIRNKNPAGRLKRFFLD